MKSTIPLFLAFLYFSTVVAAQAQTQITRCGTRITQPGEYELANDLLNCTGTGVQVSAYGVVILRLNFHQITGTGMANTGIAVSLSSREGDIMAIGGFGTISGFSTGLRTSGSGELEIADLTCTRNVTGFSFGAGATGEVFSNTASDNRRGFEINNSSCQFRNNKAERSFDGFVINGFGNQFRENTALDSVRYGIFCAGSQNEIVSNIVRSHATLYDLFEANSDCVNQWLSNTFRYANEPCIH